MTISEPTTMVTDYLLAAELLFFAFLLRRRGDYAQAAVRQWALAFVALALAAFAGGTVHGFALHLEGEFLDLLWKLTVYAVGLGGFFLVAGVLFWTVSGRVRSAFLVLWLVKLFVYGLWMGWHSDFLFVILNYLPDLVMVLSLGLYALARWRLPGSGWVVAGMLLSFVGAGVQASGFTLHRHFNHNDLYHVVQMGAFYLLYRGGRSLKDRVSPGSA